MRKKQIALLMPSSSIFPIHKEFEKGFSDALSQRKDTDISFDIHKEFIGQASNKLIEATYDKLFNYLDVDAVVGFISNKVLELVHDKFKDKKKPLLACNLGAHVPALPKLNQYIHINSMNLWAHAWALGFYAGEHIGGKGMYVSALYDSGYSFSEMFYEGMINANPSASWTFSVAKPLPDKNLSDMTNVLEDIEKQKPDFIFATFCGEEAKLFLDKFIETGLHKSVKLLGLPYLMSPSYLLSAEIDLYSSVPFYDEVFKADEVFYHLGFKAAECLAEASGNIESDLNIALSHNTRLQHPVNYPVQIALHHLDEHEQNKKVLKCIDVPLLQLMEANRDISFGWLNPYLCV